MIDAHVNMIKARGRWLIACQHINALPIGTGGLLVSEAYKRVDDAIRTYEYKAHVLHWQLYVSGGTNVYPR